MPRIIRTDAADDDLLTIGRFIAQRSGSVETALRFLDRIERKCNQYAHQPEIGDLRPDSGAKIRLFQLTTTL